MKIHLYSYDSDRPHVASLPVASFHMRIIPLAMKKVVLMTIAHWMGFSPGFFDDLLRLTAIRGLPQTRHKLLGSSRNPPTTKFNRASINEGVMPCALLKQSLSFSCYLPWPQINADAMAPLAEEVL